MGKRIVWKSGHFIVLKVRDDLYSVARMVGEAQLCIYDIFRNTDEWDSAEWSKVRPLFHVLVGSAVQKRLGVRKISIDGMPAECLLSQRFWIYPYSSLDVSHFKGGKDTYASYGGRLIDVGESEVFSIYGAPVLKHDLSVLDDRETIESLELTNMWGDLDLSDRLARYYDTGVNRDDLKFEVFPGLWDDREKLRPLTRRLPVPLR